MTMRSRIEQWLTDKWYQPSLAKSLMPLLPFSWLFRLLLTIRRVTYQKNWLPSYHSSLPVIVVGNITVGGTGKTPFVIWLTNWLQQEGYTPGIILRGVGGKASTVPVLVTAYTEASLVGDEALLLATHTNAPVVVSPNRVAACKALEDMRTCNLIISDDGLQHYRMRRNIEIIIVDAKRQFGNQQLLPAGPLREPLSRLNAADCIIENGCMHSQLGYATYYKALQFVSIANPQITKPLTYFAATTVHAIAGIGHPQQFFDMLNQLGLQLITHTFADHHPYLFSDVNFNDTLPIIMTEKDAVKCKHFPHDNAWYLAIELVCEERLRTNLKEKLTAIKE